MNEDRITESPSWSDPWGQVMKTPDDVADMLRLKACGWGLKRIARYLGCSHHTVKTYVAAGGVKAFRSPERRKLLDGLEDWLRGATATGFAPSARAASSSRSPVTGLRSAPPPYGPSPANPIFNRDHEPGVGAVLHDAKGAIPGGV
jgi:hypothetical protein